MGRMGAEDMAAQASFEVALHWHLTGNHYPPIHGDFHKPVRKAIELANNGEWGATVELPNGVTKVVADVVQELHLDPFIEVDSWEEEL